VVIRRRKEQASGINLRLSTFLKITGKFRKRIKSTIIPKRIS
jgi:hypothetical protein